MSDIALASLKKIRQRANEIIGDNSSINSCITDSEVIEFVTSLADDNGSLSNTIKGLEILEYRRRKYL